MEREKNHEVSSKKGVIFAVFDSYNHILLELRNENGDKHKGFILVPGGKVKKGESFSEAVFRELDEELGICPQKVKKIGEVVTQEGSVTNTRCVFVLQAEDYQGQEVKNREYRNIYLWASVDKARLVCKHPITTQVLDMIDSLPGGKNR